MLALTPPALNCLPRLVKAKRLLSLFKCTYCDLFRWSVSGLREVDVFVSTRRTVMCLCVVFTWPSHFNLSILRRDTAIDALRLNSTACRAMLMQEEEVPGKKEVRQ